MEFSELNLTHRFEKTFGSLEGRVRRQTKKALRLLLADPSHPGLGFKPILPAKIYYEARINRSDRLIVRPEGHVAHVIDVVEHDDIQRYSR